MAAMLCDLRRLDDGAALAAPFCIIGGGAAGIILARALLARGREVMVVESGGLDFDADIQALSAGRSVGQPYYPLDAVALRLLGGTTAIWGGRCAELDDIDFRHRPWVPHSGWPIGPDELAPYGHAAAKTLGVRPPSLALERLLHRVPDLRRLDGGDLAARCWSFDTVADRFATARLRDLVDHPCCRVLVHATATRLNLSADAGHVESVTVADIGGRRARLVADTVVVAAGAIESTRLLLASDDVAPAGVGNGHDLVGRFFMEHPHARGGRITVPSALAWRLLRALGRSHRLDGARHAALLRLSDDAQRRHGALNTAVTLGARPPAEADPAWMMRSYSAIKHRLAPHRANRRLWRAVKGAAVWTHEHTDPLRPWLMMRSGTRELTAIVRAEQSPNPDSRIRLSRDTDALGLRRVELDWRLSPLDKHGVTALMAALDRRLAELGGGRVDGAAWLAADGPAWQSDPGVSAHPIGGYHHMGTLRMADSPRQGVVDRHCRVHGVANLHIAGSAVFPTAGWANPTLTIAALALRLAARIG